MMMRLKPRSLEEDGPGRVLVVFGLAPPQAWLTMAPAPDDVGTLGLTSDDVGTLAPLIVYEIRDILYE